MKVGSVSGRASNAEPTRRFRLRGALSLAAVAMLLVACSPSSSSGGSSTTGYTEITAGKPISADQQAALNKVPESLRDNYSGFWNWARLGPNPYADWTPPKAPWQLCYSSAFQGNSWRVEGLQEAQNLTTQLASKGLAKSQLITADANNSTTVQSTQINNMVQQGCNVIFVMQPPSVGECAAYDNAHKQQVLVIVMQTGTQCTSAITSDFGEYGAGAATADWIVQKLNGQGNVVMCYGIPGVAASDTRQVAAEQVFSKAPGIHVDSITGQWTPATVKAQMLQYLATHPGRVDGVWDSGNCLAAVVQAFQQAGRPLPKALPGFDGDCPSLATWHGLSNFDSLAFPQSSSQAVYEPFVVAMRMLAGQKPLFNTLVYSLPKITSANVDQYYKTGMTVNSSCTAPPLGDGPVPDSYYDPLFSGGKPAEHLNSGFQELLQTELAH